jgi:hypothetical protein
VVVCDCVVDRDGGNTEGWWCVPVGGEKRSDQAIRRWHRERPDSVVISEDRKRKMARYPMREADDNSLSGASTRASGPGS